MKTLIVGLIGLVFGAEVGAEPRVEGWVRLASGAAAEGVQVRLFDLTDLRQVVGTTTDATGYFALSLRAVERTSARPERFSLGPNYPNPFNPATIIPYHLSSATQVRLEVFNVLGQRIATLVDGAQPAGFHTATWHGTNAAGHAVGAGLYIYRLSGGGQAVSGRMVLLDGQAGVAVAGHIPQSSSGVGEAGGVYGLTVSGQGVVPYVDPAFRVASGLGPVDLVVKARAESSDMKAAGSGLLGDANRDSRVDMVDALLVALYSLDPSIAAADNGAISFDDVNQDGQIDINDAFFLAKVVATSSTTSTLGMYWTEWAYRDGQREGSIRRAYRDGSQVETVVSGLGAPEGIALYRGKVYWTDTYTNSIQRANLDGSQVETVVSEGLLSPSDIALMPFSWMYWTDSSMDRIQRAQHDGSQVETVVSGLSSPEGIALNRQESRVYWTDVGTGSIQRSKPNGSQIEILVSDLNSPGDIDLDRGAGKMYWTNSGTGSIQRANLDGSQVETVVSGLSSPEGIALALDDGKVYWTDSGTGSIQRANLDGSQVETLVSGLGIVGGIVLGEMPDRVGGGSPDLVVPALAASDTTFNVEELFTRWVEFTMWVEVRNQGNGPAAETTMRYYSSTDSTISTSDTEVGKYAVKGLVVNDASTVWASVTVPLNAGTYYYGACVDSVSGESNTDNNCSAGVKVTVTGPTSPIPPDTPTSPLDGGPDLVVQSPAVNDSSLATGASFTLSATVLNQGDEQAAATTMRYYRSNNTTITTSDTEIDTSAVSDLAAAGQIEVSTGLTAPSSAGTYYYGACVDSVSGETDTDNNCSAAATITVSASTSLPDLVVQSPVVDDSSPATGASFTLSATVLNQGDGQATATTVRYYSSTDATISSSDTEVGTGAISSLAAAGQIEVSTGLTAPSSAGTYYYGACVDSVSGETDADNNCSAAVEVTVSTSTSPSDGGPVQSLGSPDMVVSSIYTYNFVGTSFELGATVRNQGDDRSSQTFVRYYSSTDATISTSDTEISSKEIAAFRGGRGGEVGVSIVVMLPPPGTYYYGLCVDPVLGESNTDNNCSTAVEVIVTDAGQTPSVPGPQPTIPPSDGYPDLVIQAEVSDSNPDAGTHFWLFATIRNPGDGEADETTIRFYSSTDATISTSDTEIDSRFSYGLIPTDSERKDSWVQAPSSAGTYYYGACVDVVPGETDTSNNCSAAVSITVD